MEPEDAHAEEDAASLALEDRLLTAVSALEHLLSANLMPGDFDVGHLASCAPATAADYESSPQLEDRIFALYVRAAPCFAEAHASGALAEGGYSLEMQELHQEFLATLESEMDHVLGGQGWESPNEFQESLRAALVVGGGGTGAGGEEGLRLRRGESARELLDLLDALTRFEQWAGGLSQHGRDLLDLQAGGE